MRITICTVFVFSLFLFSGYVANADDSYDYQPSDTFATTEKSSVSLFGLANMALDIIKAIKNPQEVPSDNGQKR